MKKLTTRLMTLFAVLMVATLAMQAQPPQNNPRNLDLQLTMNGQNPAVVLTWMMPQNAPQGLSAFKIYVASGQTNNPQDFTLANTVPVDSAILTGGRFFAIHQLDTLGGYSFYVTAMFGQQESGPSNFRYIDASSIPDFIKITSTPFETAQVGVEVEYQVTVQTNATGTVKYELVQWQNNNPIPAGATINETTGLFEWTPQDNGFYVIAIKASIDGSPRIVDVQTFPVTVTSCANPSTISGYITDENGDAVIGGLVMLFKEIPQQGSGNGNKANYFAHVDSTGYYEINNVDADTLLMLYNGGYQYLSEWYENAAVPIDATPIVVECNNTYTYNMTVAERGFVEFTTTPPQDSIIKVDELYTYNADAEYSTDPNATIKYSLDGPNGATIDEDTGEISWTPTEVGLNWFYLKAYIPNNMQLHAMQRWTVMVVNCDELSSISGSVTDEDGNPITEGVVMVYQNHNMGMNGHPKRWQAFKYADIENGTYTIDDVDGSDYYIHVQSEGYYPKWYNDANNPIDASTYTVECNTDYTGVNFVLTEIDYPTTYSVSGSVTNQSTNDPIRFALVEFIGVHNITSGVAHFRTKTNQSGNYQIMLRDDFTYVARAYAFDSTNSSNPNLAFNTIYWNQKTTPTEADEITLTGNMSNVNFAMTTPTSNDNSISGTLADEDGTAIENAYVIAYMVETGPNDKDMLYYGRTTETNSDGEFEIENLLPGQYVLLAFPMDRSYYPGFYKVNETAVLSWLEATQIEMAATSEVTGINIELKLSQMCGGNGRFRGFVRGRRGPNTMKMGDSPLSQDEEAIVGARVYVMDQDGNVVKHSTSETDGEFLVENLPVGTYTVVVDKIGFSTHESTIVVEESNPEVNKDVDLDEAITSIDENTYYNSNASVYPNPASQDVQVQFEGTLGVANVKLLNAIGQEVITKQINTINGTNQLTLSVDELQSGMYFIRIENGSAVMVLPVVVNR